MNLVSLILWPRLIEDGAQLFLFNVLWWSLVVTVSDGILAMLRDGIGALDAPAQSATEAYELSAVAIDGEGLILARLGMQAAYDLWECGDLAAAEHEFERALDHLERATETLE